MRKKAVPWSADELNDLQKIVATIIDSETTVEAHNKAKDAKIRHPHCKELFEATLAQKKGELSRDPFKNSFHQREKFARRVWLSIFLIKSLCIAIPYALLAIFNSAWFALILIPDGIKLGIFYYCAYKKKGTKLLRLSIIISSISIGSAFVALLQSLPQTEDALYSILMGAFVIALFSVYLWGCGLLAKVNRENRGRIWLAMLRAGTYRS